MGVTTIHWLTASGLPKQKAKVDGIVPRAAWPGCSDSVLNDPLGEPGHTPLYVGLLSMLGSVGSDLVFFLYVFRRAPFWGLWQMEMNE